MKRILLILLCCIPLFAFSQEQVVIDGVNYLLNNGKATVSKQSGTSNFTIRIPKEVEYNGESCKVTQIEAGAFENSTVSYVYFDRDAEITSIPDRCFANCYSLQSVILPKKVQSLGNSCFYRCAFSAGINSIMLDSDITYLGDMCFDDCGLQYLSLPSRITHVGNYCFANNYNLRMVYASWKNLENIEISSNAFYGIASLSYLSVPKGCVSIYQNVSWNNFTYIIENTEQCKAPKILLSDSGLTITSETPGATFVYSITSKDFVENASSINGNIELECSYTVKARAIASGCDDSVESIANIYFLDASFVKPSGVSQIEAKRAVAVSYNNGKIDVSGLSEGERVEMYDIYGRSLSSGFASQGAVSLPYTSKSHSIVIIKVEGRTIKFLPKE